MDKNTLAALLLAGTLEAKSQMAVPVSSLSVGQQKLMPNGLWCAMFFFEAPYAHPVWREYQLFAYDLTTNPNEKNIYFVDKSATHEFMLNAISPDTKVDYSEQPFDIDPIKLPQPLSPPNHGYQFKVASNDEAFAFISKIVEDCVSGKLNPDTDFNSFWEQRFLNNPDVPAWTLRMR